MKTASTPWFIDSWNVVDGLAFASQRKMSSTDARATVYIAAPHFDPEPVASIATALAATRNHFQWGFFGDDDNEIGFATLEQVREVVRRGYLGGGAGGGGFGPDEGGPPDLPEAPSPLEGGPRTREGLTAPYFKDIDVMLRSLDGATRGTFASLLEDSLKFAEVAEILKDFSGECFHLMIVRLENEKDRRPLWFRRTLQLFFLCDVGGLHLPILEEAPIFRELYHIHRHYYPWPAEPFTWMMPVMREPFADLLHWVPLPRVYRQTRHSSVGSLGDHLAQALADPTYNEGKDPLYHVIPLLFAAFMISVHRGDIFARYLKYYDRDERDLLRSTMHNAAGWLARELPGRELGTRVEAEIARMLSERIGLYHRRQLSPSVVAEISAE